MISHPTLVEEVIDDYEIWIIEFCRDAKTEGCM